MTRRFVIQMKIPPGHHNGCNECSHHGLVDDQDEGKESDGLSKESSCHLNPAIETLWGNVQVFPSKFVPLDSNPTPLDAFSKRHRHMSVVRHTHSNDDTMVLLMTGGACLNNGQFNPRAGWSFFQGDTISGEPSLVSGRLENHGPLGDEASQTSNRAELRAVLAALRFRQWRGEGFRTVVLATDSSYVVNGATGWVRTWANNSWATKGEGGSGGANIDNKDLWEMLLDECKKGHDFGLAIRFWKIPREWNTLAAESANKAAAEKDASDHWRDIKGLAI